MSEPSQLREAHWKGAGGLDEQTESSTGTRFKPDLSFVPDNRTLPLYYSRRSTIFFDRMDVQEWTRFSQNHSSSIGWYVDGWVIVPRHLCHNAKCAGTDHVLVEPSASPGQDHNLEFAHIRRWCSNCRTERWFCALEDSQQVCRKRFSRKTDLLHHVYTEHGLPFQDAPKSLRSVQEREDFWPYPFVASPKLFPPSSTTAKYVHMSLGIMRAAPYTAAGIARACADPSRFIPLPTMLDLASLSKDVDTAEKASVITKPDAVTCPSVLVSRKALPVTFSADSFEDVRQNCRSFTQFAQFVLQKAVLRATPLHLPDDVSHPLIQMAIYNAKNPEWQMLPRWSPLELSRVYPTDIHAKMHRMLLEEDISRNLYLRIYELCCAVASFAGSNRKARSCLPETRRYFEDLERHLLLHSDFGLEKWDLKPSEGGAQQKAIYLPLLNICRVLLSSEALCRKLRWIPSSDDPRLPTAELYHSIDSPRIQELYTNNLKEFGCLTLPVLLNMDEVRMYSVFCADNAELSTVAQRICRLSLMIALLMYSSASWFGARRLVCILAIHNLLVSLRKTGGNRSTYFRFCSLLPPSAMSSCVFLSSKNSQPL
jgi:hypothetical protein